MAENYTPLSIIKGSGKTPDFDRLFRNIEIQQRLTKEVDLWQKEITVTTTTKSPYFFLMPLSDLHIGGYGTDYEAMKKYLDFLEHSPVYTVLVGDLGDFFNPYRHAIGMEGNTTNQVQYATLREFFKKYKEKILAVVSDPSHNDWIYQTSGIDAYQWLVEDMGIPLLESGGILNLRVNDQRYRLAFFHKIAKYNSSLNPTHAGKRVLERHAEDIDFVVSGHIHRGSFEITPVIRGEKKGIIQLGTFKMSHKWADRLGYVGKADIFFPTIFLRSDRKDFEIIQEPTNAQELIRTISDFSKKKGIGMLGLANMIWD